MFQLGLLSMRDQFVHQPLEITFREEVILQVSRNRGRQDSVKPARLRRTFSPTRVVPMLNRPTKRIPVLTLDLQPAMVGQSKKETAERFFQGVKVFVPTTIEDAVMVFPNLFGLSAGFSQVAATTAANILRLLK